MWAIKQRYLNATRVKMSSKCHKILARNSTQGYIRDLNAVSDIILKGIINKQVVFKNDSLKWITLMPVDGFV